MTLLFAAFRNNIKTLFPPRYASIISSHLLVYNVLEMKCSLLLNTFNQTFLEYCCDKCAHKYFVNVEIKHF